MSVIVPPWKRHLVRLTMASLVICFSIFLVTGYTALYWGWVRGDVTTALPYLPAARNFGMLAIFGAAVAIAILFSFRSFPIPPKIRLVLSLLATTTIGFFSEFRNEGKFYFKTGVHVFAPGTWAHEGLNRMVPSSGSFLYRMEYSHWNDFLMGPAVVSILFSLAFARIYRSSRNPGTISLGVLPAHEPTDLDASLRFARILMNVGLFWFFAQAWGEKAGYFRNPHSIDEIDLPFEFAGTMLGFWMARVLTRPFEQRSEKFRSTLFIDFLCSGVVGLFFTLIIGPLTEGVASNIAHALQPVVPHSLDGHEYTTIQQHMRPFELLLLAAAMWWGLNKSSKHEEITQLSNVAEEAAVHSGWDVPIAIATAAGVLASYLLLLVAMLTILEPQGLGWTLATAGAGMAAGTVLLLFMKRAEQGLTTILARSDDVPSDSV
jgi:hypothetical protein